MVLVPSPYIKVSVSYDRIIKCGRNAYKANVLLLLLYSLVTHKLLAIQHIDIATEQSFRYMKLTDVKIWNSKNESLCRVFANRVTYIYIYIYIYI